MRAFGSTFAPGAAASAGTGVVPPFEGLVTFIGGGSTTGYGVLTTRVGLGTILLTTRVGLATGAVGTITGVALLA